MILLPGNSSQTFYICLSGPWNHSLISKGFSGNGPLWNKWREKTTLGNTKYISFKCMSLLNMVKGDEGKTYLEYCQLPMMETFQPLSTILEKTRSNHRRCSVRKGVLRNFAKLTWKYLCRSLFFNKVAGLSLPRY